MTKYLLTLCLGVFSLSASANEIPRELLDLIPTGANLVNFTGKTRDGKRCVANLGVKFAAFTSKISVLNENGSVNTQRVAKFQVGGSYDLIELQQSGLGVKAQSYTKLGVTAGSLIRSTLWARKKILSGLLSLEILVEQKTLLGYRKVSHETCLF